MTVLYCRLPYDEEELVEYVAVYRCKWGQRPEYPTASFVDSGYTVEMFDKLIAACTNASLELGVPDSEYPAPIANAWRILQAALEDVNQHNLTKQ